MKRIGDTVDHEFQNAVTRNERGTIVIVYTGVPPKKKKKKKSGTLNFCYFHIRKYSIF